MFDGSKRPMKKVLTDGGSAQDAAAVCAVLDKMAGVKRGKVRKSH